MTSLYSLRSREAFFATLKNYWTQPLVFSLSLSYFLLQARLDPDSYHDGFLLASAIAMADGLIPNRDFVAQYGPIPPLIQGVWVHIFGGTVFVLRTLTALQLALISILLHGKVRSIFGNQVAFIFTSGWVLGNPIDGLGSTIRPWPEVTTTLLILLMLRVIESKKSVTFSASLLGIVLAVISFNRINQVSIAFAFILFLLIFSRKIEKKWLYFTVAFYALGIMMSILIMFSFGSLDYFIQQNIIYGFSSHHENGNGLRPAFNIRILFYGIVCYLVVRILIAMELKARKKIRVITTSLALVTFILYFLISGLVRNPEQQLRGLENSLSMNLKLILENSPSFSNYVFCFLLFFGLKCFFVKKEFSRNDIAMALAIASLTSLYPTAAALKIWWVVPCAIYTLPNLISLRSYWSLFLRRFAVFLVAPSLIALTIVSYKHFSIPREPYVSKVLMGTYGVPEDREILDQNISLLEVNLGLSFARFECMRGLYSVHSGQFRSIDRHYVTFSPRIHDKRANSNFVFFCDLEDESLSDLKTDKFLTLIYESESEVPGLNNALFVKEPQRD